MSDKIAKWLFIVAAIVLTVQIAPTVIAHILTGEG